MSCARSTLAGSGEAPGIRCGFSRCARLGSSTRQSGRGVESGADHPSAVGQRVAEGELGPTSPVWELFRRRLASLRRGVSFPPTAAWQVA